MYAAQEIGEYDHPAFNGIIHRLAHELAHVQNRDILIGTIAATFAGAISMFGKVLQWGAT
jgi:hypothetical protein